MLRQHSGRLCRAKQGLQLVYLRNYSDQGHQLQDTSTDISKDSSNKAESREIHIKFETHRTSDSDWRFFSSHSQDSTFRHPKLPKDDSDIGAIPLYENHIPTNFFQKSILSLGAATAAILDPHRADMVAVLGETTGKLALSRLFDEMVKDPEGLQILQEKPRINSSIINLDELSKLPEGTLGHAYITFLNVNNVTPDSRLPVQFVDDADLAYVMQRYREVHDLFHTVLGMPTNMLGEVTVKWIEGIQTGLPMCTGGAIFGPLRFKPKQRQQYLSTYLPWALRVGKTSKLLMNVYFEKRWDQSLIELRKELCIEEPPV